MGWATYPREISPDLRDPLLDTYHPADGPDVPEAMEGRRHRDRKRAKLTKDHELK